MARQYYSGDPGRRALLVENGAVQGIDYVEVVDLVLGRDADGRQKTLLVHGFLAWPNWSDPDSVSIRGGVRVPTVAADLVRRLDQLADVDVDDTPFEAEAWTWIDELRSGLSEDEAKKVLVVHLEEAGDHSVYTLTVSGSGVPLDPILKSTTLGFKADHPTNLPAEPGTVSAPDREVAPRIDYLARDYSSFRRLLLDRLAHNLPDWSSTSEADPLVTLVEALAARGDELSYYQDAIGTEAYLHTARRRPSVRRHARLLDYVLHEGINARAWIVLSVSDTVTIPEGTPFVTALRGEGVQIATTALDDLLDLNDAQVFESMHARTCIPSRNEIALHTWGDGEVCLPKGATQATLVGNEALGLAVGDVVVFEAVKDPDTGVAADALPRYRHAVRLTTVSEVADPLTGDTVVDIEWFPEDRLPFALRIGSQGDAVVVRGNVVLADHGYTHSNEALVPAAVPDSGLYRPALADDDMTFAEAYVHVDAQELPARDAFVREPQDAVPCVTLTQTLGESTDTDGWTPLPDLLTAEEDERSFVVEMEEDRTARLRFGDGVLGECPDPGTSFTANYRTGNGLKGNVGADALVHVVIDGVETGVIEAVRNPLPARGGRDPETLDQARRFAPTAYRKQKRAVHPADYVAVLQDHPKVQRALARVRWTGSDREIQLVVDRKGASDVDDDFITELTDWLEDYRLIGHELRVVGPQYVGMDIALTIRVKPHFVPARVLDALYHRFRGGANADGTAGYFHPDHFTFGQDVYLSPIIAAAMEVPGVELVHTSGGGGRPMRFRRHGRGDRVELEAGRIQIGPMQIARVDNDRTRPEYGAIVFHVEGSRGAR